MKLKTRPPESEIPTSSMADIAFLLIIFFMVTAVFASTKGLELDLPAEPPPSTPDTVEAVFAHIDAAGALTVDCRPMEPAALLDYLAPKLERDPGKPVIVYSDPQAPYGAMIEVYDALLAAGTREDLPFREVENIVVPTGTDIRNYVGAFGVHPFEGRCGASYPETQGAGRTGT